ncbi:MAG: hypothetical protein HQM16_12035 [Deltaproteobacteria bacterium]|nr:hypothetical protein [Deltaproteobacteria bacterium]
MIIKKIVCAFLLIAIFTHAPFAVADKLTHAIGDTGYMIQEAMWAKANRYDSVNYYKAVSLQREAKSLMRGTHKQGRNLKKALELTGEAYQFAKQSRDKINNQPHD